MYGFELLVGPYAVAHYRLHHSLSQAAEGTPGATALPRLGVYLTDTLAEPGAAAPLGPLGFVSQGINDERKESNRIKESQPILAIIGNPPYRRLEVGENETLVGRWMDGLWDDLKKPVRDAGQGNQLNTFPELSVAFWRWAMWKLFKAKNAPRRGVVALITNRKFLTGWPYAGLRRMMRERFDRIEIVDLRGDARRGERAGVRADQGVFNIRVGTAITLCVADGSKAAGAAATVRYNDAWAHDLLSRQAKFDWLAGGADAGELAGAVAVERDWLDDFRPRPFSNGELISLRDAFVFTKSGMKSGGDPTFVKINRADLRSSVVPRLAHQDDQTYRDDFERFYSYRPLDRRWFFNDLALLNRPGPEMQQAWGADNVCLYAMPFGTGAGPAVWCHGLLPDYHAFRGSYGGYAFPLHDHRDGHGPYNLKGDLIEALGAAYGAPVAAEAVFDAILCLLSAASYTTRFAGDLEDVFPHIPFPAQRAVFDAAARLGADIRAVETFAGPPDEKYLHGLARAETAPAGPLAAVKWADGEIRLCADGSGRIVNIPTSVWNFSVSGYVLLPRWLAAREGLAIGPAFIPELRDIAARIAQLIDLFAAADSLLAATLGDSLTRAALRLNVEADPDS
ncbi:MAG: type ISP restriction/modification enzyme [Caulobacteraceae bacterium]